MSVAALVKELRDKTGAPMMDCKKALAECNDNLEQAVDWLRKKSAALAGKKADRVSAEGMVGVGVKTHGAQQVGVLVELNSETDFAAKNDRFVALLDGLVEAGFSAGGDLEKLKSVKLPSGKTAADAVTESVGVIGENLQVRRCAELCGQVVVPYVHNKVSESAGKIGVLVAGTTTGNKDAAAEFLKKVAMHVAAFRPQSLKTEELDQSLVERERNVLTEQARESGKPEAVIEKMIEGRIRKFYSEVVLLEQLFVMDNKTPVKDALKEAQKEIGGELTVTGYACFVLGEGVDREASEAQAA
ncbi:MAG: translation elongation factor Ts [Rickettsiales bacterium]